MYLIHQHYLFIGWSAMEIHHDQAYYDVFACQFLVSVQTHLHVPTSFGIPKIYYKYAVTWASLMLIPYYMVSACSALTRTNDRHYQMQNDFYVQSSCVNLKIEVNLVAIRKMWMVTCHHVLGPSVCMSI